MFEGQKRLNGGEQNTEGEVPEFLNEHKSELTGIHDISSLSETDSQSGLFFFFLFFRFCGKLKI